MDIFLKWHSPLEYAAGIADSEENWALLYSGIQYPFTGRHSILALKPDEEIKSNSFSELESNTSDNKEKFDNAWFGYLGYELKNTLESLPTDADSLINLPQLWMVKYKLILIFDHDNKEIKVWAKSDDMLNDIPSPKTISENPVSHIGKITSNMTKGEYLDKVIKIQNAINDGDLYQANLTRKFFGQVSENTKPFDIFTSLCQKSPAPYSCFLSFGDSYVISSSPERFIHIDSDGNADTRPIKGSAPRHANENKDLKSKQNLANSEKDKAENLMIVDLMRNDFSRSAVAGSVEVESLFDITSYATIHHMSSTVKAQKMPETDSLTFIKNCFPPGSMTGTPKIKAIELCSDLEKLKRGVYSGSIGWFGGDGSVDLSVVIRTLILQDNKFEFQVGGAIIADSIPQSEWSETMVKAKGIANSLGLDLSLLENI